MIDMVIIIRTPRDHSIWSAIACSHRRPLGQIINIFASKCQRALKSKWYWSMQAKSDGRHIRISFEVVLFSDWLIKNRRSIVSSTCPNHAAVQFSWAQFRCDICKMYRIIGSVKVKMYCIQNTVLSIDLRRAPLSEHEFQAKITWTAGFCWISAE